ncbi:AcrR family transcriptional regulator [Solibacillus kalamii]|uniref:HTH tetR-type domain-containing protein n=1 Tax=Solibacillus kalamii TaxID=1748298 RepID=A0ABX3ZHR5_9BACL|nr:TetR/AcrR family transcriptional regulator [Solibacillus kalamii]MBM7665385.1 AcrR family transcriptional regulator [Solibacillus kalamii]OUZ39216.1 hypothetical protein CBM15_08130 [Solibacillus kalamii]
MITSKNRTKHLLCSALMTLLNNQKRSFESITINEICEQAIIHRTTFYTHFSDKFALFQYLYRTLTKQRMNYSIVERIYEPFRISAELKQVHALHIATELSRKSKTMKDFIEPLMYEAISLDLKSMQYTTNLNIPEQLLIEHLRATLLTLDHYWIQEANHLQAMEIDHYYQQLIKPIFKTTHHSHS